MLLLALTAQAWQAGAPRETAPNEYLVVGTVVWAHAGDSSIAIRGPGLLGHLRMRVRSYRVKQPSVLLGYGPAMPSPRCFREAMECCIVSDACEAQRVIPIK